MEMKDFSKKTIVEFLNDKNDKKIEDCIYRLWFYTKIKNLIEENEKESFNKNFTLIFNQLDNLKIPFRVQNMAIYRAEHDLDSCTGYYKTL